MNKKRILAWLLTLCMLVNILPTAAFAAPPANGQAVYVSSSGSDDNGDGTQASPYASLAHAVDQAKDGATVYVMNDLEATSTARVTGKKLTITSGDGGPYTITRGNNFSTTGDAARGTYNGALLEVTNSPGGPLASVTITNLTLSDYNRRAGTTCAQAPSDGGASGNKLDYVQDAIIAAYGDYNNTDIILGSGAVLKDYGGMSAVRLTSGAQLTMESGSEIIDQLVTDRKKGTVPDGDANSQYYGPAGAVWMQGGTFTMDTNASIHNLIGRAVFAETGTIELNGTLEAITGDVDMWHETGAAIYLRGKVDCTLGGTIQNCDVSDKNNSNPKLNCSALICFDLNDSRFTAQSGSHITNSSGSIIGVSGEGNTVTLNGDISYNDTAANGGHVLHDFGLRTHVVIGKTGNIHNNRVWYGAIYMNRQNDLLEIYGKINDNYGGERASGVALSNNGSGHKAIMYEGAEICNNYSGEAGGGVLVSCGSFTMQGGKISGNMMADASQSGGGVLVRHSGQFIMNGGEISGNYSAGSGGGIAFDDRVYNGSEPFVQLNGGRITGNYINASISGSDGSYTASGSETNDLAILQRSDYGGNTGRYLLADDVTLGDPEIIFKPLSASYASFWVYQPNGVKLGERSTEQLTADQAVINEAYTSANISFTPIAGLWYQSDAPLTLVAGGLQGGSYNAANPLYAAILQTDADGAATGLYSLQLVDDPTSFTLGLPANDTGYAVVFVQEQSGDADFITITATAGTGGSVTPSGSILVLAGDNLTFTITPDSGYTIADVVVDGESQGAVTSYTLENITESHSITATFQAVSQPETPDKPETPQQPDTGSGGGIGDLLTPLAFGAAAVATGYGIWWLLPVHTVTGIVFDSQDERVEGAVVTLLRDGEVLDTAETAADGSYSFKTRCGNYQVRIQYTDPHTGQAVDYTEDIRLTPVLQPAPYEHRAPVQNAG